MGNRRILVVDDEPIIVSTIAEKLAKEGFQVRGATDGNQALELYRQKGFDLVLTDMRMAEMGGLELLKAILQYDPEALVVMITAFGTMNTAVEAMKLGAKDFISKPFELNRLVAKIRFVLEQERSKGVRGDLRDLGLTGIISISCNEMLQAQLLIRRKGQPAEIYFEKGNIVHAALDGQEGEEAIYELLSWEDGSFSLKQGVAPPKYTIETDWRFLLLEGMRRIDEERTDNPVVLAEQKLLEIVGFLDET
jgi:DNA-binding response OmpR family regulator